MATLTNEDIEPFIPEGHEFSEDDIEAMETTMGSVPPRPRAQRVPGQRLASASARERAAYEAIRERTLAMTRESQVFVDEANLQWASSSPSFTELTTISGELRHMAIAAEPLIHVAEDPQTVLEGFINPKMTVIEYVDWGGNIQKLAIPQNSHYPHIYGQSYLSNASQRVVFELFQDRERWKYFEGATARSVMGDINGDVELLGVRPQDVEKAVAADIYLVFKTTDVDMKRGIFGGIAAITALEFTLPKIPRRRMQELVYSSMRTVMQQIAQRHHDGLAYQLEEQKSSLKSYEQRVAETSERVKELEVQTSIKVPEITTKGIKAEMEKIKAHPQVEDAFITPRGDIVVLYHEIMRKRKIRTDSMGRFMLILRFSGDIRIYNRDYRASVYDHPNISDGSICMGNAEETISNLQQSGSIFALVDFIAVFLAEQEGGNPYLSFTSWFESRTKRDTDPVERVTQL